MKILLGREWVNLDLSLLPNRPSVLEEQPAAQDLETCLRTTELVARFSGTLAVQWFESQDVDVDALTPRDRFRTLKLLFDSAMRSDDFGAADRLLHSLTREPLLTNAQLALAHGRQALLAWWQNDFAGAITACDKADLARGQARGYEAAGVVALVRGVCARMAERQEEARRQLSFAHSALSATTFHSARIWAQREYAWLHKGHEPLMRGLYLAILGDSVQLGMQREIAYACLHLGILESNDGHIQLAERYFSVALAAFAEGHCQVGPSVVALHSAALEKRKGVPANATDRFVHALEVWLEGSFDTGEADAWEGLGNLQLSVGRPRHALVYFARGEEMFARAENTLGSARCMVGMATALLEVGRPGEASRQVERIAPMPAGTMEEELVEIARLRVAVRSGHRKEFQQRLLDRASSLLHHHHWQRIAVEALLDCLRTLTPSKRSYQLARTTAFEALRQRDLLTYGWSAAEVVRLMPPRRDHRSVLSRADWGLVSVRVLSVYRNRLGQDQERVGFTKRLRPAYIRAIVALSHALRSDGVSALMGAMRGGGVAAMAAAQLEGRSLDPRILAQWAWDLVTTEPAIAASTAAHVRAELVSPRASGFHSAPALGSSGRWSAALRAEEYVVCVEFDARSRTLVSAWASCNESHSQVTSSLSTSAIRALRRFGRDTMVELSRRDQLAVAFEELSDAMLPGSLAARLRDSDAPRIYFSPDSMSWSLPVASLRLDCGEPLIEKSAVALTPNPNLLHFRGRSSPQRPESVLACFDQSLPGADREQSALAKACSDLGVNLKVVGSLTELMRSLGSRSHDMLVVAAHGDAAPGLEHSLVLGTERLSARSLLGLEVPGIVVLGSCSSAALTDRGAAYHESWNLPSACLARGADDVICLHYDASSATVGSILAQFYGDVLGGISPVVSLQSALRTARQRALADWSSVCLISTGVR